MLTDRLERRGSHRSLKKFADHVCEDGTIFLSVTQCLVCAGEPARWRRLHHRRFFILANGAGLPLRRSPCALCCTLRGMAPIGRLKKRSKAAERPGAGSTAAEEEDGIEMADLLAGVKAREETPFLPCQTNALAGTMALAAGSGSSQCCMLERMLPVGLDRRALAAWWTPHWRQ